MEDRLSGGHEGPVGPAVHGGRIGSYAVERKLGEGGMGSVYLARSRGGRAVAVKVARAELAADPDFRRRFRAEIAAARMVGGFHTAPVVDADPDAPEPWLATAYVPGPTLAEHIDHNGPMNAGELTALGAALAEALEAIHRCGLVHRDLKPGNIVMADDGPRVIDFGIARAVDSTRLTATNHAFGTPGYLAPEQATGGEVTGMADVFALGAVLTAAAGGRAFGTGTPMSLMYRSVHEAPDLSALPDGVRDVAAACLDKEPSQRPGTARLLDWFEELAGRTEGGERPGSTDPRVALLSSPQPPPPRASSPELPYPSSSPQPPAPPSPYAPTRPDAPRPPRAAPTPLVHASEDEASEAGEAFMAADADTAVVVDADGVVLLLEQRWRRLDEIENGQDLDRAETEAEFAWVEIADVTIGTADRTYLTVTVVLRDGSSHFCAVNARRAARLNAWRRDLAEAVQQYLRR
ncbi:serine/threonine-protein kinase [Streptomyces ovatisporus]|uniref:Serine/threonine-protein kinase n=1 Tax=Streptomyces ovatisporus TaxID=1128682 RepID=A0ABV9A8Y2_9ACTN